MIPAVAAPNYAPIETPPPKGSSTKWIAIAALVLVLAAGASWYFLHQGKAAPVETAPAAAVTPVTPNPAPAPRSASKRTTSPGGAAAPASAPASPPTGKQAAASQSVRLSTVPEGVALIIDGKSDSQCQSPCSVELPAGRHTVVARKEGYYPLAKDFNVDSDHPELSFTLGPVTGSLLVSTDPPGVAIAINGVPRSEVTPANFTLPVGQYKVRLTREGYEPLEHEVTVTGDGIFRLTVSLAKPR